MLDSFLILLPLIVLALGGYCLSWWFSISEDTLVRAVTDFFMPLLVFTSLYTSRIDLDQTLRLGGAVTLVLGLLLVVALIYCRVFKLDARGFVPPLIFMNSGFLGIPLMELWSGNAAMSQIIIYDQIQTFYIFTVGIVVVAGGLRLSGIMEIIRTPLIWAIVLGFALRHASVQVPPYLLKALSYCGGGAPALATFALGCSLRERKMSLSPHLLSGLLIRFGLGFLAGVLAVHLFDIRGSARMVVIVASALPSAVFSVVLPLRYGVDARFAGGMVLVSTALSILALPLLFQLAARF